ncbi:MAG TPA: response regulator, partial [Vicinamibacteria bacterium]
MTEKSRASILIVDDESHTRELCNDILSEEGYHTSTAESAREGLLALAQRTFQIVLSDIQMP